MTSIQDVLDDRYFYSMSGFAQPVGKTTSMMIWNPEGSGVAVGIRQSWTWSSDGTEFNMKWRTTSHGTGGGNANSLNMGPGTLAASAAQVYVDKVGITGATPPEFGHVLLAAERVASDITFAVPPVFMPGSGIIIYPDTLAAINWTWAVFWEEMALPA